MQGFETPPESLVGEQTFASAKILVSPESPGSSEHGWPTPPHTAINGQLPAAEVPFSSAWFEVNNVPYGCNLGPDGPFIVPITTPSNPARRMFTVQVYSGAGSSISTKVPRGLTLPGDGDSQGDTDSDADTDINGDVESESDDNGSDVPASAEADTLHDPFEEIELRPRAGFRPTADLSALLHEERPVLDLNPADIIPRAGTSSPTSASDTSHHRPRGLSRQISKATWFGVRRGPNSEIVHLYAPAIPAVRSDAGREDDIDTDDDTSLSQEPEAPSALSGDSAELPFIITFSRQAYERLGPQSGDEPSATISVRAKDPLGQPRRLDVRIVHSQPAGERSSAASRGERLMSFTPLCDEYDLPPNSQLVGIKLEPLDGNEHQVPGDPQRRLQPARAFWSYLVLCG